MASWNFATLWEIAAENVPDAPALLQGDRVITWAHLNQRADGIARLLIDRGAVEQDKVALYLYNCPEYLESCFACFKAGLVPVNTNYRYADDELLYLWDNADAVAVVFHGTFGERIERIRERAPRVHTWLWVDDGAGDCPSWAIDYETGAKPVDDSPVIAPWGRGEDDLLMIYTGGTTGMPKGVMWRQDDLVRGVIGSTAKRFRGTADYAMIRGVLTRPGRVGLPACPLMHGTGWFSALAVLSTAGCVVTLAGRKFDAEDLLDAYARYRVNTSAIVGDAFAKPMLAALETHPGRWDLSDLMALNSSGVMWSEPVKAGLLRQLPKVQLVDNFGSSEAMGMGQSVSTSTSAAQTAKFSLSANTRVVDENDNDVVPGSGQIGRVAVRGHQPIGYYKDPEKSARTFVVINGERYSIPGDYAAVEADGTLVLLGRGSVCINTGGEKVYPEEVEEALKLHDAILDAVVVGVPDERFGEAITAIVELKAAAPLDEASVIEHVKARLASYKAPKHVLSISSIDRAPNAKVDYKRLRTFALERLGIAVR